MTLQRTRVTTSRDRAGAAVLALAGEDGNPGSERDSKRSQPGCSNQGGTNSDGRHAASLSSAEQAGVPRSAIPV